jgi:predicted adenylyl cyclase CyaB
MPRNIEIKARAQNWDRQKALAQDLSDRAPQHMIQEDTFFNVPSGRLKLRIFEDGTGELIQYERENTEGPRESRYVRVSTDDPQNLKLALAAALGIKGVVRKTRTLIMVGKTRIHFDEVEGLGNFIELEVVLHPDAKVADGVLVAEALKVRLEIRKQDLVASAYIDLIAGM